MKLSQFKFKLPEELIAKYPVEQRDEARLLVVDRRTGEITPRIFREVLDYFDDGDMMVFNDTQVFPARLYGNKGAHRRPHRGVSAPRAQCRKQALGCAGGARPQDPHRQ